MNVIIAKNAGFCFGVKRAMKIINDLIKNKNFVCTMGDVINNQQVVNDLNNRGVRSVKSINEVKKSEILILRSHGMPKEIVEELNRLEINYVDTTCPFVKKIHKIVSQNSKNKKFLLVAGYENHPEVKGIRSYFSGKSYVFSTLNQLKEILSSNKFCLNDGIMVSQTTFSNKEWKKCVEFVYKYFTSITVYDTICNVTNLRQLEIEKLSKLSDLIIIVGGYHSSNTNKLKEISLVNSNVIHIEKVNELETFIFKNFNNIVIAAGASTPIETVLEVKKYLEGGK